MGAQRASSDPTVWSANEIARAVSARMISIPEVVDAYLRRLDEISYLNAVAWSDADVTRLTAKAAQARFDRGELSGPLVGVPFTVKDVIATGGVPTRAGSRALADNVPRKDATAVANIRRAGGILIGKSTCPEFALSVTTASDLHGRTLSPWGPELSPGGSSGGEGVLLACGASALGIGTDFGGSLRWPAQCAGVLALRPSVGRVPSAGQLPGAGGDGGISAAFPNPATLQGQLQVIGPMARTVADLRTAVSVLAADGERAGIAPVLTGDPSTADLAGLSFGWCVDDGKIPCTDDVRAAMQQVVTALRGAGLRDVFLPRLLVGGFERYNQLRDMDSLAEIRLAVQGAEALLTAEIQALVAHTDIVDATQLSLAWQAALEWRARFLDRLRDVAVLVAPVAPGDATGHDGTLIVNGHKLGPRQLMAYCRAVSLTALPVVSMPCAMSARGLPLSVQIIGRPFGEDDVLAVAGLVEKVLGGARLPPRAADSPEPCRYSDGVTSVDDCADMKPEAPSMQTRRGELR